MPGTSALLDRFSTGALLRPGDPAQPSTVDLALALASLAGAPVPRSDGAAAIVDRIGDAEHLVFVLVDGLGLEVVEALPPSAWLRQHVALGLRSVFPSATASALTSLATGLWPNRHAIPGWWTYLPDRDLTITCLPFVERWSGEPLPTRGVNVAEVFPAATLLTCFTRDAVSFLPAAIADTAYSRYVRGATPTVAYDKLPRAIDAVIDRVRGAAAPTYSYLYLSSVDALSHTFGPHSHPVRDHLAGLDAELARLANGLAGRARLALSADHGLIEVPAERKHLLLADDPLVRLLRAPPSGEPRSPLFHVREGARDAFRAAFDERFGRLFTLLATDEAESLELFGPGPPTDLARARIGDFVAVAHDSDVILYRPGDEATGTELLVGYHGGLLPAEVRIPLVVS
jgi:hypothetical protein